MSTKDEDFVTNMFVANTHTALLFFTTDGMVYKLKTWRLPLGGRNAKGKAIVNILPIDPGVSFLTSASANSSASLAAQGVLDHFCLDAGRLRASPALTTGDEIQCLMLVGLST